MGLYSKYVASWIINKGCGSKPIQKQREKVLPFCHGKVLEIGAGSGLNFSFYQKDKVSTIYALEPDDEMLRQAQIKAATLDIEIKFLHSVAENIPLPSSSVDVVLLTYTLCSIPNPAMALKEMRRVLKVDGKLVFAEHGKTPDRKVNRWQNLLNSFWPYLNGGCNLNRNIPDLLTQNGFAISNLDTMYLPGTPKWMGYNFWGLAEPQ